MLYCLKLCVLTFMVFLAVLTGLVLAIFAWPNGEWGLLNTLMSGYSLVMFAASWYLAGCFRHIKKTEYYRRLFRGESDQDWRSRSNQRPHTIIGQGEYRKELKD